jgi:hypothetical protein
MKLRFMRPSPDGEGGPRSGGRGDKKIYNKSYFNADLKE